MKFAEIRNDYLCDTFTPEEGDIVASISIDTWMTDNDNEEGKVVSKKTVKETSNKQKTEIYETVEYNEQGKIAKKIIKQFGPETWKNPLTNKVEPKINETTIEYEYDANGKLLKSTKKEGKLKTQFSGYHTKSQLLNKLTNVI